MLLALTWILQSNDRAHVRRSTFRGRTFRGLSITGSACTARTEAAQRPASHLCDVKAASTPQPQAMTARAYRRMSPARSSADASSSLSLSKCELCEASPTVRSLKISACSGVIPEYALHRLRLQTLPWPEPALSSHSR